MSVYLASIYLAAHVLSRCPRPREQVDRGYPGDLRRIGIRVARGPETSEAGQFRVSGEHTVGGEHKDATSRPVRAQQDAPPALDTIRRVEPVKTLLR
jgi:hypothetical protein